MEYPINYNDLVKSVDDNVTDDMRAFVASQIGRENMLAMSHEAWANFLMGVGIWGISVGVTKIV